MDVFSTYAPFIQDFIYRNGWSCLRGVQLAAADAIFNTDENVLLCASTASGKTEAAFFPILTDFYDNPPLSVGAIYIGPLKALINDQFMRLNDLCSEAGIPVWHWHGDVSQSHKNKMLKNPSGILQITPESLEAMLLHKHSLIPKLFSDLRYIVIDEVHSLMRADRGRQTICLIQRLSRLAGVNPRRIGLSATLGEPEKAGIYLSAGTGRGTIIPKIEASGTKWRISMEHFYCDGHQSQTQPEDKPLELPEKATDVAPEFADPGYGFVFEHTRNKKCLVFVNSREECELVTTSLRSYCSVKKEPDRFMIHHGNLSQSLRETAEQEMKDDEKTLSTVTTATLELGIDIGRLERAFQIDAPFTVSSFLQRMGRTGRRGEPQEMWFVIREDRTESRALLPETVPWKLLQAIALVQSYVEDRFVEPPLLDRLPYSLLYHQTMSVLASSGEMSPAAVADKVLTLEPFRLITQDDYKVLLRHLIQTGHIERTERGGLIVGLAGERQINSFKFYAVFQENEEYTVRCNSQELGTVVAPPPTGEKLAIAGHVWIVTEVDRKRHLVYCEPVLGRVPAYFGQCPGDINTKILRKMRDILRTNIKYPYLMQNAVARLREARSTALHSDLTNKPVVNLGGNMWCVFPWLGTYSFLALERVFKILLAPVLKMTGIDSSRPYFIQFSMSASYEQLVEAVRELLKKPIEPMSLLFEGEVPEFEKYDKFLPDELVRKGFAYGVLDVKECTRWLKETFIL